MRRTRPTPSDAQPPAESAAPGLDRGGPRRKLRSETADGTPPEMAGRRSQRSSRCRRGRVLLLLAVLPAILCGPAFGGAAAWIHAHGFGGVHVHLLPDEHEHDHDVATLGEWHDAQGSGHEDGEHDEDGPAPKGLLIELPELVAASP